MLSIINIRILTINPVYTITPLTGINYDFTMAGQYLVASHSRQLNSAISFPYLDW